MAKSKAIYDAGIEVRGKRIRIIFTWNRERIREPWPYPATEKNIERAKRIHSEITKKIDLGKFTAEDFTTYFPHSLRYADPDQQNWFGSLAQTWLDTVEVGEATREEYKKVLNKHWLPLWGGTPVHEIRTGDLRTGIKGIEFKTEKTRNNALIPLRGVFEMAFEDEVIDRNPMARIKNKKHQREPPDPFTREEMEQIINWLYANLLADLQIHALYFEFAFWSGMRPSELIALLWSDYDERRGYVRVQKAKSKGRLNQRTKTATIRDVMLNKRSSAVLKRVKK